MPIGDPIFMLDFSATQGVRGSGLVWTNMQEDFPAAARVIWYELHGGRVELITEDWKLVAPNIWLATSPKR